MVATAGQLLRTSHARPGRQQSRLFTREPYDVSGTSPEPYIVRPGDLPAEAERGGGLLSR